MGKVVSASYEFVSNISVNPKSKKINLKIPFEWVREQFAYSFVPGAIAVFTPKDKADSFVTPCFSIKLEKLTKKLEVNEYKDLLILMLKKNYEKFKLIDSKRIKLDKRPGYIIKYSIDNKKPKINYLSAFIIIDGVACLFSFFSETRIFRKYSSSVMKIINSLKVIEEKGEMLKVPKQEKLMQLVKSSLKVVILAIKKNEISSLYKSLPRDFRKEFSDASFSGRFKDLVNNPKIMKDISLSKIRFKSVPSISLYDILIAKIYFEAKKAQVGFVFFYKMQAGKWKLCNVFPELVKKV